MSYQQSQSRLRHRAPIKIDIDFHADNSHEMVADLHITNTLNRNLTDWLLHFDIPKEIDAGSNTVFVDRVGSHVRIGPNPQQPLAAGQCHTLQIRGHVGVIRRFSDLPAGMFVHSQGVNFNADLVDNNLPDIPLSDDYVDYTGVPGSSYADRRPKLVSEYPSAPQVVDSTLIPLPQYQVQRDGFFVWPSVLHYSQLDQASDALDWLSVVLPESLNLATGGENDPACGLEFVINTSLAEECYWLHVSTNKIVITANSASGFTYGVSSLLQLIVRNEAGEFGIACVEIEDKPRFEYRGLMIDCARQFQDKERILRILDVMAAYKLNRFHWHLTDDEGWRIEIKTLPQLTDIGAWRGAEEVLAPQFGSGATRSGGYYSQDDIREIVEYARQRQIMVIPEIDVPGHSRAAIKSLPEMLVEAEDESVYYSAQMYRDNVLNPALPGTYDFLYAVLDEVCELFPSPYIHIGADEIPHGAWQGSPACQAMMQAHGYHDTLELQGHFFSEIQKYLAAKGKTLAGWEEASYGEKLESSAVVYAWSGTESANNVAAAGYRVIGCPAPFAYLDMAWNDDYNEPGFHWAGTADLAASYAYRPLADDSNEILSNRLMGVQALLWGELIQSTERLEYMLFPRLFAMAETAWSKRNTKDWAHFQSRVKHHLKRFKQLGINHRAI